MRCAVKRFDKVAACLGVNCVFGAFGGGKLEFHACFESCVFTLYISCEFVEGYAHLLFARGVYAEHGMCGARNGVAQVAAVDFAERYHMFQAQPEEEACEQLVGVGAALVDVAARVAA